MISGSLSRLPVLCFYEACPSRRKEAGGEGCSPNSRLIVRKGSFYRSSDSRRIARFRCLTCKRSFSRASGSECFGQKKRRINEPLRVQLVSGVSHRQAARNLGISRHTVAKKALFLKARSEKWQRSFLRTYSIKNPVMEIQFDEMESSEISKCLPVSIPLVVESKTRLILGFRVCSMPAKGHLAKVSLRKYGPRADERAQATHELLTELKPFLPHLQTIRSDENPKYPSWIEPHFPKAKHLKYKGRRGHVAGQGEMKVGGFDPLFSLNHTAAMLRAKIARLFRRTWNTTKRRDRLAAHISIYVQEHNQIILSKLGQ